jgi:hypothetical protein
MPEADAPGEQNLLMLPPAVRAAVLAVLPPVRARTHASVTGGVYQAHWSAGHVDDLIELLDAATTVDDPTPGRQQAAEAAAWLRAQREVMQRDVRWPLTVRAWVPEPQGHGLCVQQMPRWRDD